MAASLGPPLPMKIDAMNQHYYQTAGEVDSNGTGGTDPVIEPDPANVQEPLIGAFKPVEQLLSREVGSLRQKEGVYDSSRH